MGQTVQLGYGKANLSHLATYSSMKVTAPFERISAITTGKRMGAVNRTMVGRHEMHGAVLTVPTEVENGTVVLLQAKWMKGGVPRREGGLFVRLRVGAPLYQISGLIPTDSDNICGDAFTLFQGYADILNPSELELLGIRVPGGYISRHMDPQEMAECFRITQLAGETQPRPVVTAIATPEGIQIREVQQAPARRLNIRR